MSEEERVRRRREINRNSQKRIRERRNKEMDELKAEVGEGSGVRQGVGAAEVVWYMSAL
jgi:hypothetical protein